MTATMIRIPPEALDARIDATYYRPEFVQNENRLATSGLTARPLKSLIKDGRRAVYFSTSTFEKEEAPEGWVPFLTSDDFGSGGFFIDLDSRRYVSPEFADRYPNGELRANELLVKVKGPNQITAYREKAPEQRVLVSGTIWGATVRLDRIDPHYLVTALSSPYAVLARTRLRTNLNVEFLSPADLLRLELPVPKDLKAQRYIGDKVRQAERLRQLASEIDIRLRNFHETLFPDRGVVGLVRKTRRVPAQKMTERLDAHFYPAAVESYMKKCVNGEQTLQTLCSQIKNGQTCQEVTADGVPQVTVANLANRFLEGRPRLVASPSQRQLKLSPHDLLLCNAAHNKDYIGKEITYCDAYAGGIYPSTEVMCLRLRREETPASYIRAFLLSPIGYLQIQSTIRGITAHAYPSDVGLIRVPIPVVASDARERFKCADGKMLQAGRFIRVAESLVAASMVIVEALIDGTVREVEVSEIQAGLERGDDSAERAFMARLYEKGIDETDSDALFADLEAYYETIKHAEEAVSFEEAV